MWIYYLQRKDGPLTLHTQLATLGVLVVFTYLPGAFCWALDITADAV